MILALEMIKELIKSQKCVVNYERGDTYCPVCRYAGLPQGDVLVGNTVGEIRYCTCCTCGATFTAIGEKPVNKKPAKKKAKPVKLADNADKKEILEHNENDKKNYE